MKRLVTLSIALVPLALHAQTPQSFRDVSDMIVGFLSSLLPLLAGFAVVVFFWGLITYIWKAADSSEAHERGRRLMLWGIIALFVMMSIWGLVELLQLTLFGRTL